MECNPPAWHRSGIFHPPPLVSWQSHHGTRDSDCCLSRHQHLVRAPLCRPLCNRSSKERKTASRRYWHYHELRFEYGRRLWIVPFPHTHVLSGLFCRFTHCCVGRVSNDCDLVLDVGKEPLLDVSLLDVRIHGLERRSSKSLQPTPCVRVAFPAEYSCAFDCHLVQIKVHCGCQLRHFPRDCDRIPCRDGR